MTTEIRERPILFSAPMVRAILEGRKTQTRRPVKGKPQVRLLDRVRGDFPFHTINACAGIHAARLNKHGAVSVLADDGTNLLGVKPGEFEWLCPYGAPGDRLWVRETWSVGGNEDGHPVTPAGRPCGEREAVRLYRADTQPGAYRLDTWPNGAQYKGAWRPSIHMPRWASRLTLEVVSVRVERLDVISEVDAIAEGVTVLKNADTGRLCVDILSPWLQGRGLRSPFQSDIAARCAFSIGWDALYAKSPDLRWNANPWVWVVEFKRVGGAA